MGDTCRVEKNDGCFRNVMFEVDKRSHCMGQNIERVNLNRVQFEV